MIDFVFQNPTKIYFGKSALSNLKNEAAHWGERVLLVYGGGSIKRTGVYDQVMAQLAGTQVWELGGVQPNPRLSLVREGIRLCREHGIQLVLAVGGGAPSIPPRPSPTAPAMTATYGTCLTARAKIRKSSRLAQW